MTTRGTATLPARDELVGTPVFDANDDGVGTVKGVYVDPADGSPRYLAVDSGWFGDRRHVIPVDEASARGTDPDKEILLPYSREKLSKAPTFEEDRELTLRDESAIQEYYGLESYEAMLEARQTAPAPTPAIAEAELKAAIDRGDDPGAVRVKRWGV